MNDLNTPNLDQKIVVSPEERESILRKVSGYVHGAAGSLPHDQSLYLEQQLSDLFGFEVTSSLDEISLPYTVGTMAALSHLKRHPADMLADHSAVLEAGLDVRRGSFGWFTELGQLTANTALREQYYVSLPLEFLPEWQTRARQLKEWFAFRKVLVVNPVTQLAAVAVVGDIGPSNWMQYQFGGSPEIIRELGVWQPESQGKVMMMFVHDPEDQVPLGIVKST